MLLTAGVPHERTCQLAASGAAEVSTCPDDDPRPHTQPQVYSETAQPVRHVNYNSPDLTSF